MKLFILISHYEKLALTLKDYLTNMLPHDENNLVIEAIGGIENGTQLGTEPMKILEMIDKHPNINEIFIFSDLGSATLGAEAVAPMVENKKIHIGKGAFVENTFSAYVLANSGASFEEIENAAEEKIIK